MSANNISQITATNTFGQWKDVTNQIVDTLGDVVTLGDSTTENRAGNIYLNGSITATDGVVSDVITPDNQALNEVLINANARALGGLTLDRTTTLDSIVYLQFQNDSVDTWAIETAGDHDHLQISKGSKYLRLDDSDSLITANGLTIDNGILPDIITADTTGESGTVASLDGNTTDGLSEGSTNLYHTDARARASISVSGDLSYNSTSGVISYTQPAVPEYTGSTGVSVTANGTDYQVSIGQDVATDADVEFGSVKLGSWVITQTTNGDLSFSYDGAEVLELSTTGSITASGNINAEGEITAEYDS